jgi:Kdo2-lipid IVA lauroyltransferase/acyltransferase
MIDYLGYILIKVLSLIFCLLPPGVGLFIGRRLGWLACILNKKRRAIAYSNLKAAFCSEKSPSEIRKIVKGVYRNLGQVLIEVLRFPVTDRRYVERFVSIDGFEKVSEVRSRNNGLIMLTAHFGNWELLGLVGGFFDLPLSVLAREQKHSRLNELLNSYRAMTGSRVIKKGLSTRQLIKALRANEIVGILADQDAGKLGVFVDFFGRPTSTHSGTFIFAQKTGARVLPAFLVRQKGPYHKLKILEPIEVKQCLDYKEEIVSGIQKFSNILESYVREFPEQWLWLHKRWKSTPVRSIIILNDGKQGHLNQSIAVAEIIKRYREDKGCEPCNTSYKVINVKYRHRLSRLLLGLCSNFSSSSCQGCMACVKFCLEDESYKALASSYADIVISCGSSLAPVNIFLARELNAKNVVIMKPGLVSLKRFKLAIVPKHDKPKARKNVLMTIGSPNCITEDLIQKEAKRFSLFLDLKRPARLGLILGGDTPDYRMEVNLIKDLISQVKGVSEKLDLEILVTTSRRTPKEVEKLLKDELDNFPGAKLIVIANENNIAGAIPAIMGLSKVVLVSGESISMISEAASSGKVVLAFPLKKKKQGRTRHEQLLDELDRSGFIRVIEINKICTEVDRVLNSKISPKRLNDSDKIYNAAGGLL